MHLSTAFPQPVKKPWQAARNREFFEAHEHLFRPDRHNPDSTPTAARAYPHGELPACRYPAFSASVAILHEKNDCKGS